MRPRCRRHSADARPVVPMDRLRAPATRAPRARAPPGRRLLQHDSLWEARADPESRPPTPSAPRRLRRSGSGVLEGAVHARFRRRGRGRPAAACRRFERCAAVPAPAPIPTAISWMSDRALKMGSAKRAALKSPAGDRPHAAAGLIAIDSQRSRPERTQSETQISAAALRLCRRHRFSFDLGLCEAYSRHLFELTNNLRTSFCHAGRPPRRDASPDAWKRPETPCLAPFTAALHSVVTVPSHASSVRLHQGSIQSERRGKQRGAKNTR